MVEVEVVVRVVAGVVVVPRSTYVEVEVMKKNPARCKRDQDE